MYVIKKDSNFSNNIYLENTDTEAVVCLGKLTAEIKHTIDKYETDISKKSIHEWEGKIFGEIPVELKNDLLDLIFKLPDRTKNTTEYTENTTKEKKPIVNALDLIFNYKEEEE